MNTANLLNINVDNNSNKPGKLSAKGVETDKKQAQNHDSGVNADGSRPVSNFEKALKESMTPNQNSQNHDGERQEAANDEISQDLPEDGKSLPSSENVTNQIVEQTIGAQDANTPVLEVRDSDSTSVDTTSTNSPILETNIQQGDETGGQIQSAVKEPISTQSYAAENTVNQVQPLTTDVDEEQNNPALENPQISSINDNAQSTQPTSEQAAMTDDETKIQQLDFIEQAQNTATTVGINTSAVKDVFQNISGDENKFKLQNSLESVSGLQNIASKGESVFSGSLQNSNATQQGTDYQNNFSNILANNAAKHATNPAHLAGVETQNILSEADSSVLSEKLDSTKASKVVSETIKPNTLNEPLSKQIEFTVKTPVLNRGWNDEVNNQISYVAKNGGGNAKIKLNPAYLGPVEASIKIAGEGVTVQINANNNLTRDALDQGATRLKEMLQEQGFTQVDVNVSDQGLSKGNRESTTMAANASNHSMDGDLEGADGEIHETPPAHSTINGVVDYYA